MLDPSSKLMSNRFPMYSDQKSVRGSEKKYKY